MRKELIADVNAHEARVALVEGGDLVEIHVEMRGQERLVGNIYKGRVANILPGMQAAFVDVGLERNAFLYAGDIIADKTEFDFEGGDIDHKLRPPDIRSILHQGQEIMVQVLKQQGGTKGARVTTHVTLPGRFVVLMPTVDHIGVSRRIVDETERERLKTLCTQTLPAGMGVIVRTVAEGCLSDDISNEIKFLSRLWERIKRKSDFLTAPRLIHSEESLIFRTVRDMFLPDIDRFLINDNEYYEKVCAVVDITMPEMSDRVEMYSGKGNIFDAFGIESKIEKALNRRIWLKSGAYLVIDETEALTVIDVNTGKYIGAGSLQETILNCNIEAAQEIARQLRLRDIGGIVIIDFIDMECLDNRAAVVDELKRALEKDRTKSNVLGMTELGLVEMTRKKVRQRLSALVQNQCPYCGGSGKVYSEPEMAMRLRREMIRVVDATDTEAYLAEVAPSVAKYIVYKNSCNEAILPHYNGKRFYLKENRLAHLHDIKISPVADPRKLEARELTDFT